MTWLNVGAGPHPAPEPWVNLDCHDGDGNHPDVVVDADDPCATFPDGSAERVYMGHVLEHVAWPDVPRFLQAVERVLAPGGQLCVVGPDVLRTVRGWSAGRESWTLVQSVLENPWDSCYEDGWTGQEPAWEHARHWWNCYEARVVYALENYTDLVDVRAVPITPDALAGWPVVGYATWQCAASGRKP